MRVVTTIVVLIFWVGASLRAQSSLDSFLKPSDTLHKPRLRTVLLAESILATSTLAGLYQLWYADYPQSSFHFVNDNDQWLQMDKLGHVFSSYHLGRVGADALKWSGCSRKSQLIYGATLGLGFLTAVEIMDGFSEEWGASGGDIIANLAGTGLYISQELLWNEQRIIPKFSFHPTRFASSRPQILGSSLSEQILKDYNGQTYWLSANIHSFFKESKIPRWLNVSFGYGAEGMLYGSQSETSGLNNLTDNRYRQFYLSLDVDLSKIKTESRFVKTLLTVFNTIKIPAPTFEIKGSGGTRFHVFYF